MIPRKSGRIVNVASTQAIASEARVSSYAASKGGLLALTRSLAVELAPYDVLVNSVTCGCIHTPMCIIDGVDETETEAFKQWYVGRRKIPLGRPGRPDEVAGAVLFLASDDCQYLTGQAIIVDGGLTITF
jgi:NAD(P)-dependent dehydrogenase (short-subunit alcohol dehydrogenase family)